jgi:hypothetical protein
MSESAERRDARNARRREQRAHDPDERAKDNARRRAYYQAHRQKMRERANAYYQANKEWIQERARASRQTRKRANDPSLRSRKLKRRYGISAAEYDALLTRQGGVCAICRKRSKERLCVDHCHLTGTIRGLLCRKCNTALGYLKDDQASLVAALAYLGALPRDGPGSAAQRALAVHDMLPPWPTRRAVLTYPPIRCDAAPRAYDVGEMTSGLLPTSRCVPDAVQRGAAQISLRNLRKLDCAAERCTADPGPPRTVTVHASRACLTCAHLSADFGQARDRCLQRSTSRCAAPGTGERSSTSHEGDDMTIDDAPPAGGKPTQPMRDALDAALARASDDGEGNKADVLQLIARRLAAKALEGDLGAIREIFDRIDGKTVAGSAPEQTPRQVEMQWKE